MLKSKHIFVQQSSAFCCAAKAGVTNLNFSDLPVLDLAHYQAAALMQTTW